MTTIDRTLIISKVIAKYLIGGLDANEQQLLDQWLLEDANNQRIFDRIVNQNDISAALIELERTSIEPALSNVNARIAQLEEIPIKTARLWPRIRTAAAIAAAVATIVFGVWFFSRKADESLQTEIYATDIAPGKNGATITLSTGQVIALDSNKKGVVIDPGSLTYEDGTEIASGAVQPRSELNLTASTAKGQTYEFKLPDGSKVWLNADSKIIFPLQFSGKERKILLEGEGYFEVAKNKERPFIVAVNNQQIKVLGTHFNVNGYKDEPWTVTTLLEGSVQVNTRLDHKLLKPGQESIGDVRGLRVRAANIEAATAWKNGVFIYDGTPLEDVMRQLSRWYDVEVVYENATLRQVPIGGAMSRYDNVSRALKTLENTGAVKFELNGRKIIVKE